MKIVFQLKYTTKIFTIHDSWLAGFVQTSDSTKLPLSFSNPELELLSFPDIFPDGHGHYDEVKIRNENGAVISESIV